MDSIFAASLKDVIRRLPIMALLSPWLMPDKARLFEKRKQHRQLTAEKIRGRMAKDNNRDDFFAHLLSDKHAQIGEDFLLSHASTLIVAGSE